MLATVEIGTLTSIVEIDFSVKSGFIGVVLIVVSSFSVIILWSFCCSSILMLTRESRSFSSRRWSTVRS